MQNKLSNNIKCLFFQGIPNLDPFILSYFEVYYWKLQVIGLWPFSDTKRKFYLKSFWSLVLDIITMLDLVTQLIYIYYEEDIVLQVQSLLFSNSLFETLIKSWTFLFSVKKMQALMFSLSDLYMNTPVVTSLKIKTDSESFKKRCDTLAKFYHYIAISINSLFVLSAIIKYIQTREKIYFRPACFPEGNYFHVLFSLIQIVSSFRVHMLFVTDVMFAAFILLICNRIDVVFETMKAAFEEEHNQIKLNLFKQGVEYHKKILK